MNSFATCWSRWSVAVITAAATAATGLYFGPPSLLFDLAANRKAGLQIERGASWFQTKCAGCHVTGDRGPDLARIGEVAATRRPGMSAEEYLLESILEPSAFQAPGASSRMPDTAAAGMGREDIRDLIAFLMSLGAYPDRVRLSQLRIEPLPASSEESRSLHAAAVLRGQKVFYGKGSCASCHQLDRRTGNDRLAPPLFGTGQWSREELRAAILRPSQTVRLGYQQVAVRTSNGDTEIGRLIPRADGTCAVLLSESAADPPLVLFTEDFPDPAGTNIMLLSESPMPAGYDQVLSSQDLDDLTAFLGSIY